MRPLDSSPFLIAAWLGLSVGMIEGAAAWLFHRLCRWEPPIWAVPSLEMVWMAALFYLFLFGALAVLVAAVGRLVPRLPTGCLCVFLFCFLAFVDGLALSGYLALYGVVALGAGLAAALTRWFRNHQDAAMAFGRGSLPWLAAFALLTGLGIEGGLALAERRAVAGLPAAFPRAPNVLVIVVDALRADRLSGYGYARRTSPALDRLAEQGVLFESAFAPSSWTLPSHASLLNGLYPHEQAAGARSLAEALRARGYRTGAFSANTYFFNRRTTLDRGFIHFEDYARSPGGIAGRMLYGRAFGWLIRQMGSECVPWRRRAEQINAALLRWIDRERGPERPFLAVLNYLDVHDWFLPPADWRDKFSAPGTAPDRDLFRLHASVRMTPEELQRARDAYDGCVAHVDDHIGRLLAELGRRGIAENTLVVITSDHGEGFGEHGLFRHGFSLYREVIRVPLILRLPGRAPAGVRVPAPVSIADLPATLLELAGAGTEASLPGRSLARLWETPPVEHHWKPAFSELGQVAPLPEFRELPAHSGWTKSLVTPQWHYIVHEKLGEELYNWPEDPQELRNLAAQPELRGVLNELAQQLRLQLAVRSPPSAIRDPHSTMR